MKKSLRLILFGILIWIVPFVVAFAFYDSTGKLTTSEDFFKSTMIVVSALAGCFSLSRFFIRIEQHFTKEGLLAGLTWLVINLALDVIILVPYAKMEMKDYIMSIGIRYLQIPIISYMAGWMLDRKINTNS